MSNMIKKYIEFLNEKLTDNLKGFDEQGLKQQFLNGEISLNKFMNVCVNNKIDAFMDDDVLCEYDDDFYVIYILDAAIKVGSLRGIKYGIEHDCSIEFNDNEIIRTAIMNNRLDILKYAFEQGAEIDLDNNYYLQISIKNKNFEIIKCLVEYGIKINDETIELSNKIDDNKISNYLNENIKNNK